jgi:hypothetical protein
MTVMLRLTCGGCPATVEVGPLHKRFHGTHGDWGFGTGVVDPVEDLAPEGWVMFDPYTYCTYCPACWQSIVEDAPDAIGAVAK